MDMAFTQSQSEAVKHCPNFDQAAQVEGRKFERNYFAHRDLTKNSTFWIFKT